MSSACDARRFPKQSRKFPAKKIEQILLAVGLLLMGIYVGARLHTFVASRLALARFGGAGSGRVALAPAEPAKADSQVDFALWSQKRIHAYEESLAFFSEAPAAVLEIPKLRLRVPVFDGTDDLTLNRGVGRIIGTAKPGKLGNIGIAGHRDGFFRGLKDIAVGDAIELETREAKLTYAVDQITIVTPDDVRVLDSRPSPSITLVTCYPFYFVGDAPKRYIVFASLKESVPHDDADQFMSVQKTNQEVPKHD
jgi:sortase A